jgi:hypothetical protein
MDIGFSDIINYQDILTFLMFTGRAMSLYMDFLQLGKDEFPELKKAILKRELSIINSIAGLIGRFEKLGNEKQDIYLQRLYSIREKLIELRFSL